MVFKTSGSVSTNASVPSRRTGLVTMFQMTDRPKK